MNNTFPHILKVNLPEITHKNDIDDSIDFHNVANCIFENLTDQSKLAYRYLDESIIPEEICDVVRFSLLQKILTKNKWDTIKSYTWDFKQYTIVNKEKVEKWEEIIFQSWWKKYRITVFEIDAFDYWILYNWKEYHLKPAGWWSTYDHTISILELHKRVKENYDFWEKNDLIIDTRIKLHDTIVESHLWDVIWNTYKKSVRKSHEKEFEKKYIDTLILWDTTQTFRSYLHNILSYEKNSYMKFLDTRSLIDDNSKILTQVIKWWKVHQPEQIVLEPLYWSTKKIATYESIFLPDWKEIHLFNEDFYKNLCVEYAPKALRSNKFAGENNETIKKQSRYKDSENKNVDEEIKFIEGFWNKKLDQYSNIQQI